mgnify:FL=1|tara:strand:- start:308 stop:1453 length:1146 start_codon:yes stop_codon:yes gene_type:complete
MAYNVLKGSVQGSVDQHADQEIDGIKIFKNTISASVFYDTDAESPCATMKDVAITTIKGARRNSVLTYGADATAIANFDLTYENNTLSAKDINCASITASACGLRDIPVHSFMGKISAEWIKHDSGLSEHRGALRVNTCGGLLANSDGLKLKIEQHSGLAISNDKLTLKLNETLNVTHDGQNIQDPDLVLLYDASRGDVRHSTLQNLYEGYIASKVPRPAGPNNSLQIKAGSGFTGNSSLTYDGQNNLLSVQGSVLANVLSVSQEINANGKTNLNGAVAHNIKTISNARYEVGPTDYTVVADTSKFGVSIILPCAADHLGRVLNFKKTDLNKYRLSSNILKIVALEGNVDRTNEFSIKMNYSSVSLQSDGTNWLIISARGS